MTLPSGLPLDRNGKLYPSELTRVEFVGRGFGDVHILAARAWNCLVLMCKLETGMTLTVTSTADAYRRYWIQEYVFRDRYRTPWSPICTWQSKLWNGVRWFKRLGVAMAATPGTSNHGWGLAFDACWLVDGQIRGITSNTLAMAWMEQNAPTFGFYWNVGSEPWHLEYCTGDAIPQRVLDIEAYLGATAA
jgi:hypothetical protein